MPERKRIYDIDLHFEKDHVWAQVKELPGVLRDWPRP
jgi:hypothetical protein